MGSEHPVDTQFRTFITEADRQASSDLTTASVFRGFYAVFVSVFLLLQNELGKIFVPPLFGLIFADLNMKISNSRIAFQNFNLEKVFIFPS